MTVDIAGHPTTGDPRSVELLDHAVDGLLRFAEDVGNRFEATVTSDPGFAMGQIARAYLRGLSTERAETDEGQRLVQGVDPSPLHDRERRHLQAVTRLTTGDLHGAADTLTELSVAYPTDALALAVGHQLDFLTGDAASLRDRIGRAVWSWDRDDGRFGFVLGMQAFGLEEAGHYAEAEAVGREALDRNADDVWAHHAVTHVYEMQGRVGDGIRLMDTRRHQWAEGNFLAVHNSWHEALFHLESGNRARSLQIYDEVIGSLGADATAYDLVDASALLWRYRLEGDDVGDRWEAVADQWAPKVAEPCYAFNDAHAVMAFVGADRLDDVRDLVARREHYVHTAGSSAEANVEMTAEVGLPVCRAMLAFAEERYDDTVALLFPIRRTVHRFGGSHAQRDAIARTLLEAAIRSAQRPLATALVSERLALRPSSSFNARQLQRLR